MRRWLASLERARRRIWPAPGTPLADADGSAIARALASIRRLAADRRVQWAAMGGACLLALWLGAVAVAEHLVHREAERRHLTLQGACQVRPGLLAVRLSDCRVSRAGSLTFDVDVERVTVEVDSSFRPKRVRGVLRSASAVQSPRDTGEAPREEVRRPLDVELEVHSLRVRRTSDGIEVSAEEASVALADEKVRLDAGDLRIVRGDEELTLSAVKAERAEGITVSAARGVLRVHVAGAPGVVRPKGTASPGASAIAAIDDPRHDDDGDATSAPAAPVPAPSGAASAALRAPSLAALDERLKHLKAEIARRVPAPTEVTVEALSLVLGMRSHALTLGPGRFEARRGAATCEVSFETAPAGAGPALKAAGVLPFGEDDVTLHVSGGPVPLSLADEGRGNDAVPSLAGDARFRLSPGGREADAEGSVSLRGLVLDHAALAAEPVGPMDLGLRFDALARGDAELDVRSLELSIGDARLRLSGRVEQSPKGLRGGLTAEVPLVSCDTLLRSMPHGLFPTLRGARLQGTLAGSARLSLDTTALDDLDFAFGFDDRCKFVAVPEALDGERFTQPFHHRTYHPDGTAEEIETGPGTPAWTPLGAISPYMTVAVVTTEDGGFFRHHGINHRAMRDALVANLRAGRFVRGASTISMQLAKNLFLGREKTLSRKLEELVLTEYLEQAFEKDDILELYLNVIEFGPDVYGITAAADHYFGRTPNELTMAECMFLSSLLPSPVRLHGMYQRGAISEGFRRQVHALLRIAGKRGLISPAELADALAQPIEFHAPTAPRPTPRPPAAPHRRQPSYDDDWQELPTEGP